MAARSLRYDPMATPPLPDFFCPNCGAPLTRPGAGGQFRSDHFRCPRCKNKFDVADALTRPPRKTLLWAGVTFAVVLVAGVAWLMLR